MDNQSQETGETRQMYTIARVSIGIPKCHIVKDFNPMVGVCAVCGRVPVALRMCSNCGAVYCASHLGELLYKDNEQECLKCQEKLDISGSTPNHAVVSNMQHIKVPC